MFLNYLDLLIFACLKSKLICDNNNLPESNVTLVGGELENVRDFVESVRVKDARLHRRSLLRIIQDYTKRLLGFTTKDEVIIFEAEEV